MFLWQDDIMSGWYTALWLVWLAYLTITFQLRLPFNYEQNVCAITPCLASCGLLLFLLTNNNEEYFPLEDLSKTSILEVYSYHFEHAVIDVLCLVAN